LITICKTKGIEIEEISVVGCALLTDEVVVQISKNCKEVKYLDLSSTKITDVSLQAVSLSPKLEVLKTNARAFFLCSCLWCYCSF